MKKTLCYSFLFVMMAAFAANAVVIHWAVSDTSLTAGVTSAQLVYVGLGAPTFSGGSLSNGEVLDTVGSTGITPVGIGEQNTYDGTPRTQGNYYVVLFDANDQYRTSGYLAYNDPNHRTSDPMFPDPLFGNFDPLPCDFTDWAPVPEPGSLAIFALGVGLLALRRKNRS